MSGSDNHADTKEPMKPPPPAPFTEINVEEWTRKPVFNFYKDASQPLWGITVRLNVTAVRRVCKANGWSYLQGSLYLFSMSTNQYAPIRYRIRAGEGGKNIVICHKIVHPSVTVMRKDGSETYGFVFLKATDTFTEFREYAQAALEKFHTTKGLDGDLRDDVLHGSVLPWLDFTSYEHAVSDLSIATNSIPKYTFGKLVEQEPCHCRAQAEGTTWSQSLALHVNHALMDGLHVGRFIELLQQNFDNAETLLKT